MKQTSKKLVALLLILFSLFSVVLAESPVTDETPEVDEDAQLVRGFVIENEPFFAMEEAFRMADFSGEMSSIELSETQTLIFNPNPVDRLLPALSLTISDADPFVEDADALAATVGSLIGTLQYLQEQFPEVFLFNDEMAALYEEAGLSYLVAEPDIWLWPTSAGAVLIPICFYENTRGTLIDDMYLLEIMAVEDGGLCYILYNDPQRVADYMEHVSITADESAFQYTLAFWYLKNYMLSAIDLEQEDGALGMLRVSNTLCFVRASDDSGSRIVSRVRRGEWYPVLSESNNGWFEIRLNDGTTGFISPNLVEFFPKETPGLQNAQEEDGAISGDLESSPEGEALEPVEGATEEAEVTETEEEKTEETVSESAEAGKN